MKADHPKTWVGKAFTYKKKPKKVYLKPIERHVFIVSKVSLLPNGYKVYIDFNNGSCLVYHSRQFRKIFKNATMEHMIQAGAWNFYFNTQISHDRMRFHLTSSLSSWKGIYGSCEA